MTSSLNQASAIRLSVSLRYPITITSFLKQQGDIVNKHDSLFKYSYTSTVKETDEDGKIKTVEKQFVDHFDSPLEGQLKAWLVDLGGTVTSQNQVVLTIFEPCAHAVQFAGLCAQCGRDITTQDYTGFQDAQRAPITMGHDSAGLMVSVDVSDRPRDTIEYFTGGYKSRETSNLAAIDLGKTLTVDPTVGEWKSDPSNPNYNSVKDVAQFQLSIENAPESKCWYYLKMRPGLFEFLQHVSKLYEMHIYTMGTRSYAEAVAKVVDPDGSLFGERILSRDESGSLTQKNLQRLFPCDTSMVVVIDDRADVWQWSPNLIKVMPYDFFVGIGDINSSFLPKKSVIPTAMHALTQLPSSPAPSTDRRSAIIEDLQNPLLHSAIDQILTISGGNNPDLVAEQASQQTAALEAQKEDRPLAKLQEAISAARSHEDTINVPDSVSFPSNHSSQNLLRDDDLELFRLKGILNNIHKEFFDSYKQIISNRGKEKKLAKLESNRSLKITEMPRTPPDIKNLMPRMKRKVLNNCVILLSGIIPIGADIKTYEFALWIKDFGGEVLNDWSSELNVTHVVAARPRTAKVKQAHERNLPVVRVDWLLNCLSQWRRVPEHEYRIYEDGIIPPSSPNKVIRELDPEEVLALLSSEEEFDLNDAGSSGSELPKKNIDTTAETVAGDIDSVDWTDAQREVDEALAELSDNSTGTESSIESFSNSSSKRKRARPKSTISSSASTDTEGDTEEKNKDLLRSPLAKRRRKARQRKSRLANSIDQSGSKSQSESSSGNQSDGEESDGWDDFAKDLEAEMG
ncbi:RNA polymerase II subunit A C-terminal domain phosphatase [Neolecta irregularis DAH-3]|uniref:RNA polymerase II subunit A C-terminal domain phosphatase n=1 Tax=Neolecta irregularis (strain DAH-3) TaxID=1198029 RepID=A0A1U7LJK4_NEOID|nr:RNA polymerase II subunit A C-terminal domain phosphatase [Neolecta irregularis DAH-3]|eukprot:OLL22827.1 RNA polymerase II subunit A C-terminal domain phosphatase [Neolecta irregularis DAH-3]